MAQKSTKTSQSPKPKTREVKDVAVREALAALANLMTEWRGTMPSNVRSQADHFVEKVAGLEVRS